jgi:hypothetical protein
MRRHRRLTLPDRSEEAAAVAAPGPVVTQGQVRTLNFFAAPAKKEQKKQENLIFHFFLLFLCKETRMREKVPRLFLTHTYISRQRLDP